MNIVSIEGLSKTYGDKVLFQNVNWGIQEGEKWGLIGVNGTGKTTFLKTISGFDQGDSGRITIHSGMVVEYLPQNPHFDEEATVLQQIFKGNSPLLQVIQAYEETSYRLEKDPENVALQNQLIQVSQRMDAMDGWALESEAKAILQRLGITDLEAIVGKLSGGQRKRVAMAGALIRPSDLLILDEPTNHIDQDTIGWLEDYLSKRKGALLMVTHDRYFLDRVVNHIVELDRGNLYTYEGSYSVFLERKQQREEEQQRMDEKKQSLYKSELLWMRAGVKARGTKQKARIQRFEELSDSLPSGKNSDMEISLATSRIGKKIIEMEEVSKAFGAKVCLKDFTYFFTKEDRVGIIGPNGRGKSTLLNLIAGKLQQDSGVISIGETIKIGYYTQENVEMDETLRVIDYIREEAEYIENGEGYKVTATQMLEKFMFAGAIQYAPISKLSGGEKRRLYLLRVLMGAPNVLLLDEPTNDLDIQTLNILEEYIEQFPGPVLTVSHDRYFLDKICDKIFEIRELGQVIEYTGNYSDYAEKKALELKEEKQLNVKEKKIEKKPEPVQAKAKFSYKEKREFEEIEGIIEKLEEELETVNSKINNAGSDFEALQKFLDRQKELEAQLEEKMERWEYLNEITEQMK